MNTIAARENLVAELRALAENGNAKMQLKLLLFRAANVIEMRNTQGKASGDVLMPQALFYRPFKHDEWGFIRTADGGLFAVVHRPLSEEEADAHRAAKTDPFEDLARRLISTYEAE